MVEGAPLLREYTREGIVGSNPILSAIKQFSLDIDFWKLRTAAVAPPVRRYSSCCFVAVRTTYSQRWVRSPIPPLDLILVPAANGRLLFDCP